MTSDPILRVTMLGGFELYYGQETVRLKKRQSAKPVQLLLLLLYNRKAGISRHMAIEALYGPEAEIDIMNNLNVTVSQLRKLLRDTILPEENYIYIDIGRYNFQSSFPVQVDTEEILSLRQKAASAKGKERAELLYRLCTLYHGRFLPELDGEEWVENIRIYCQRIFQESMDELCHMLWETQSYQEILHLTSHAARLFPFDEWQAWQYECLLAQGQIHEAKKLYREVEALYLKELDAPPPKRMRQQIHLPRRASGEKMQNVQMIRDQLDEADQKGPYCLPFPSFLDAYNLICRMSKAASQPVCLMLCTIRGGDRRSRQGRELCQTAMEQLEASLYQNLRREDAFTRYSRYQYLSVLIGVSEADCGSISRRVSEHFFRIGSRPKITLDCQTVPSVLQTGQN